MDSMFNGLGLGSYVNQDKSKLVNKMIGDNNNHSQNNNPSGISKSASSQSLSLQEKQRIVAEQESAQNRAASKSPTPSKSVNLTDTLVTKSMSMNQISPNPTPWNNTATQPQTSNWNGSGGMSPSFPQASFKNPTPAFGNFSQPANFTSMNSQPAAKPDLSAFDTLMSGPAQTRQPMNAMQGPGGIRPIQPLIPSNMNQFNPRPANPSQAKPLSFNEINDLLS